MAKKLLSLRVWIYIITIVLSIMAINPRPWASGVEIKGIAENSIEAGQGFAVGEKITSIDKQSINTVADYVQATAPYDTVEKTLLVETKEGIFTYNITNDLGFSTDENLTVTLVKDFSILNVGDKIVSINGKPLSTLSELIDEAEKLVPKKLITIKTDKKEYIYLASDAPDLRVGIASKTNIKKGLELQGGTRVLLKPETNGTVTDNQILDLVAVLENRLNVYGLADLRIKPASDLDGNKFVMIELAGATREEVRDLIGKQGIFEAKIGEEVVFVGGKGDIPFVCKNDGSCAGIIPPCQQLEEANWACRFQFSIKLSPEAAKNHAAVTSLLSINSSLTGNTYLSKTLDLYLDGKQVDSLQIGADLKGREITDIAISGSGYGQDERAAVDNALKQMNKLQTVLITGSLPLKLNIEKLDTISPVLGSAFIKNSLFMGIIAILIVGLIIFIRYRSFKISFPIMFVVTSEAIITLGFAALLGWNMDLASIAGIIAAIGTGVNDQIVITDEVIRKESALLNWKEKIKRAFGVVMAAYATLAVAMIPLWFVGAGLIRGFAVTTLIGITIGVFITRPAFASIIETLMNE
ncbi:MAG TPA: hypothetical protein VJB94_00165 [Candidatus Nanoarchaeia archaeon]|nr:hypothetical protein [Candidatus Nanoarchaeia archaeon]